MQIFVYDKISIIHNWHGFIYISNLLFVIEILNYRKTKNVLRIINIKYDVLLF